MARRPSLKKILFNSQFFSSRSPYNPATICRTLFTDEVDSEIFQPMLAREITTLRLFLTNMSSLFWRFRHDLIDESPAV